MSTEDFWSATIAAFAPLISAPQLTDKLLQRPPFRFIHDLVSSIDQRFQAYNHLFTEEELDSAKLDSKEKKIQYLEKLITFVAMMLGRPIDVSPKKIVAGLEPEKTNAFLRDVALAIGYAQQYKQNLAAAAPPPPPPAEDASPPPPPPPPPAEELSRKPNLQINTTAKVPVRKAEVLQHAVAFQEKIAKMGIDMSAADVKISEAIRAMERELKTRDTTTTEPAKMPAATLEMAIQRQMESIAQIKALIDENNFVCSELIESAMSTF